MTQLSPPKTTDPGRDLSGSEFRDVIGHFASGVTVITVQIQGEALGTTASAVCSVSLEPPMVLICMNKSSSTGQAINRAGAFAINILSEDQGDLAQHFARKSTDKFKEIAVTTGPCGQPLLDDSLAHIECKVQEAVTGGTHTVFLAKVINATAGTGAPLAYFRGQFGRLELQHDAGIYAAVRERVLSGTLPAGEPFELLALALEMGTPPGPLYHALGKLTAEGLVERTPSGAFTVPPLTWPAVREALDACCAIELGVVNRVAGSVPPVKLDELTHLMEQSLIRIAPGAFNDADVAVAAYAAFHEAVVRLSGSEALVGSFKRLALAGILARTFRGHVATEADAAFGGDHRDLLRAIESGDRAQASAVVIRHYDRFAQVFRAVLR